MQQGTVYILCPQRVAQQELETEQRLEFRAYFAVLDHYTNSLELFEAQSDWVSSTEWLRILPRAFLITDLSCAPPPRA